MRKHTALIMMLLISFFVSSSNLSAQEYAPLIQAQAQKVADAFVNGNLNYMVRKTPPEIISTIGGQEKMLHLLQKQMDIFLRQDIYFESIEVGVPTEIVLAEQELHCLVPQKIVMHVADGKLISNGYLLAISQDQGNNWYFLDTAQLTNENVERMIPNYNQQLKIPEKTKAEFVQN